jgi:hypothetical protein
MAKVGCHQLHKLGELGLVQTRDGPICHAAVSGETQTASPVAGGAASRWRIGPPIGAVLMGYTRLAIRRIVAGGADFTSLAIEDLTVIRLRAADITVSDSLKLPLSDVTPKVSS